MRVVVQRCLKAKCSVDGIVTGEIDHGYMILVGFTHQDQEAQIQKACKKIVNLRIFEDENGKMNLNLQQVQGKILSISQFTLYADTQAGNRPSFTQAMEPHQASHLYDVFNDCLRSYNIPVETGIFGGDMKIDFINDGPVTIVMEF